MDKHDEKQFEVSGGDPTTELMRGSATSAAKAGDHLPPPAPTLGGSPPRKTSGPTGCPP